MKTAEELLKEKGIKPETVHHNYAYVYRAVCGIIGEVQKEAYNQAMEGVAAEEMKELKEEEMKELKEEELKTEVQELIELIDRLVKDDVLFVTSIDWDTSDKTMGIAVKFAMPNPQIYEAFKMFAVIQESQKRSQFEWQWKVHP